MKSASLVIVPADRLGGVGYAVFPTVGIPLHSVLPCTHIDFPEEVNDSLAVQKQKSAGGRPKQVAVFEEGRRAQENFAAAARQIFSAPKPSLSDDSKKRKRAS